MGRQPGGFSGVHHDRIGSKEMVATGRNCQRKDIAKITGAQQVYLWWKTIRRLLNCWMNMRQNTWSLFQRWSCPLSEKSDHRSVFLGHYSPESGGLCFQNQPYITHQRLAQKLLQRCIATVLWRTNHLSTAGSGRIENIGKAVEVMAAEGLKHIRMLRVQLQSFL